MGSASRTPETLPHEVFEASSGRLLFHNDYFQRDTALFLDEVWEDVAEGLLEELPDWEPPED